MADKPLTPLARYRAEHSLSLEGFGELIGKSKGHVHEIERTMRCSAKVALDIERMTHGAIDASTLNDEIAQARRAAA